MNSELDMISRLAREKEIALSNSRSEVQYLRAHLIEKEDAVRQLEAELLSIESVRQMLLDATQQKARALAFIDKEVVNQAAKDGSNQEESPEDWLRSEYRQDILLDVAKRILEGNPNQAMSSAHMTAILYDVPAGSESFIRARNSLSATLRRGVGAGLFKKVGRGSFQANQPAIPTPEEEEEEDFDSSPYFTLNPKVEEAIYADMH
jgi:hypothetical protein